MKPIKPMLCELADKPFNDERHIWEIKYDGIRAVVGTKDGSYSIQSRSGKDKTAMFPELELATKLPAILDGELVCYKEGKLVFNGIQHRNRTRNIDLAAKEHPATYEVFDVLWADGQDLQGFPLEQRKKILAGLLIPSDNVKLGAYTNDGVKLFQYAMDNGIEGVVGKRMNGRYRQGARDWLKVKCVQREEFIICGYTEGTGWRASTFGALVLGKPVSGKLLHVGSVGTGFDEVEIGRLYQRMLVCLSLALHDPSCPFDREPEKATWIKPVISVMVQFLEYTNDGRLRFPSYKGMTN